jgi:hypothetical protein
MNERIQELMTQAGYPDKLTYGTDLVMEKFAELIIQDCIDILAGYRGNVIWKNEDEMHQHPILVIQKHFGVKE